MKNVTVRNYLVCDEVNNRLKSNSIEIQNNSINPSDYKNRVLNLFGAFDGENINAMMEKLLKWEEEDAEILYKHSQQIKQLSDPTQLLKPIIININSPGGYVDELFALIDMLESMSAPVVTRAYGKVCSCGFVLFCIGDERYVGNNASLMYHEIAYGIWGKDSEVESYQKYAKKIQKRLDKLISVKTGITLKKLNEWKKEVHDKWLDSKQVVDMGIATDYLY